MVFSLVLLLMPLHQEVVDRMAEFRASQLENIVTS
jgi:hypothetical protein